MGGDLRIDRPGEECFQPVERPLLVSLDEARISGDIGREDGREPTFNATSPSRLHAASSMADYPIPIKRPARIKQ